MNTIVVKFGGSSVADNEKLKIEIIKYNNTGLGITNKIKVTSKKDQKKIQESIEEIKLVPEREMVDLSIMRQIEINYNLIILILLLVNYKRQPTLNST